MKPDPRAEMLALLEEDLRASAQVMQEGPAGDLFELITYHMGWNGEHDASGKRVRPLLLLLSCAAAGGDWHPALPAAGAVEWLHNFSLVHDDIEDQSEFRRGRPTLWSRWGIPLAINAGDAIFALSRLSVYRLLERGIPAGQALEVCRRIDETSLSLTQGQHIDIRGLRSASVDEYLAMVEGKTAALIASCCELGAMLADAHPDRSAHFGAFGLNLGLAFQVLDDLLGIWGTPEKTGKPAGDDLIAGKLTLPVVLALSSSSAFTELWDNAQPSMDLEAMMTCLEEEQIMAQAEVYADRYTNSALEALQLAQPEEDTGRILEELASSLLQRRA